MPGHLDSPYDFADHCWYKPEGAPRTTRAAVPVGAAIKPSPLPRSPAGVQGVGGSKHPHPNKKRSRDRGPSAQAVSGSDPACTTPASIERPRTDRHNQNVNNTGPRNARNQRNRGDATPRRRADDLQEGQSWYRPRVVRPKKTQSGFVRTWYISMRQRLFRS